MMSIAPKFPFRSAPLGNAVLLLSLLFTGQAYAAAELDPDKPIQVSKFRVIFKEPVETRYAVEGDPVEAYLQQDLIFDGHLLAPADSPVFGHIETVTKTKKGNSKTKQERFKRGGSVKIAFDRIAPPDENQLQIDGRLMPQNSVFSNGEKFRRVIVGSEGEIVKAESLDIKSMNDFGISIPESTLKIRDRYQINIEPGDNLFVRAELNGFDEADQSVSARLVTRKKSKPVAKDQN